MSTHTMKTILAIDPGAAGGLAVRHGVLGAYAYPMPDTEGDVISLLYDIRSASDTEGFAKVAVIESQTGCVGTRVSAPAMFKFGRGFGFLLGALQATNWKVELIRPQEWQKPLGLGTARSCDSRTAWKNKLKQKAQQLYPGIKVTLKTADALLMLEYCVQKGM